jgi:Flp pilus assembly pilin Flp
VADLRSVIAVGNWVNGEWTALNTALNNAPAP